MGPPDRPTLTLDSSRWPLLVLTFPERIEPDDLRAAYAAWEVLFARGPHAVITDLRRFNPVFGPPTARRLIAEEVEKRRPAFDRLLVAEARVVGDRVVAGLVTAFDWVIGGTFERPVLNTTSMVEAEAFALGHLGKHGLTPP